MDSKIQGLTVKEVTKAVVVLAKTMRNCFNCKHRSNCVSFPETIQELIDFSKDKEDIPYQFEIVNQSEFLCLDWELFE